MIEQAGLSIAISEGAGLRIADCPETFSPAVNLPLIFIISFSTHFAGEMQGLRTVHISGVFGGLGKVCDNDNATQEWTLWQSAAAVCKLASHPLRGLTPSTPSSAH
jgi:hypothetical protein